MDQDQDDPFGTLSTELGDRTVIRPRPGGKGPVAAARPTPPSGSVPAAGFTAPYLPPRQGANKLESAAAALLSLLGRLRDTPSHPDPAALKRSIIEKMRSFERKAEELGVEKETIFWARYALCSALDEIVLATPWGNQSAWRDQSLLISLHNEGWGGEKFFQLLRKLLQNPARNLELLELMYICLAFGFEGRYRPLPDGFAQLQGVRDNLYRTIRNQHGESEPDLSAHWQGVVQQQNPLVHYVPLWVMLSISGVLLLLIYSGFSLALNVKSDPLYAALHNIARNVETVVERAPPPAPSGSPVSQPGLRELLADEIAQGRIALEAVAEGERLRIAGDGLFASGSVTVNDRYVSLIKRIAGALEQLQGEVRVVGHSDDRPIRTLRYPSNWHLSRARAASVASLLSLDLSDPQRVQSDGVGDAEPMVSNETREGRARNRRVEITLMKP
ncbi:MAG: type IVB secretion system protein IcmH/DotU [Chromatiales bacterium]|jgi:type VI secretion system protein ImpK